MPPPRIGCSGWIYKSWKGRFYPAELPASGWLRFYTGRFNSVEVNNTFYRLPDASTFAGWRAQTPAGFLLAVKASRFLTHMKKLRDPEEPIGRLLSAASALGPRLGPVLYQLPPNLKLDLPRLEHFLAALPARWGGRRLRHVIEFREPSWYCAAAFALLERYDATLCIHDKKGSAIDGPFIGPIVYVRFHGTSGHYAGSYPPARLEAWAERLAGVHADGREVFAYFNNDLDAAAPANAATLQAAIDTLRAARPRSAGRSATYPDAADG